MANHNPHNPGGSSSTKTVIWDASGQVVLAIGLDDYFITHPDGSTESHSYSHNIVLVDGTSWNPGMLICNPPVYVGLCDQCRSYGFSLLGVRKPRHGVLTLARGKLCATCGTLCCPAHRKLGYDNKWRCLRCAKAHTVGHLFKSLFFAREEES